MVETETQPQVLETSHEQLSPAERLYRDALSINRLSDPSGLPESFTGGLNISRAGGLDITYDGEHFDKVESQFREPDAPIPKDSNWRASFYLANGKVQRKLVFSRNTDEVLTARQTQNGRWTGEYPLNPNQIEEFHKILDAANKTLLGRQVIGGVQKTA